MINIYIATFHSHYGAIKYCKSLKQKKIKSKTMPVPRFVSSSCGTCVVYESEEYIDLEKCELDSIYLKNNEEFELVYISKN